MSHEDEDHLPSARKVFLYFLLLGFINIGGPVAQITMMYNHTVEKERWLTKDRFTRIMAFCHLLPGPEALQLAIYIGYLKKGLLGGTLAGLTFIFPGALLMVGLSYLYVTYGNLPQVQDMLFVLKPAVLGIIGAGIIKLGRAAIKSAFLAVLVAVAVAAMVIMGLDFLIVLFGAGVLNLAYTEYSRGSMTGKALMLIAPVALAGAKAPAAEGVDPLSLGWLFLKTGLFSFGGAYASLIFVQHGAVEHFHWLTGGQLLDGVAMSVATPGPFMLFTTFVGYLARGVPGAIMATFAVFLPSFVFVMFGIRYLEKAREQRQIQSFLSGASAAVVGVIVVVSWKLAPDALTGIMGYTIAVIAFLAIMWGKRDVALVAIAAMVAGGGFAIIHALLT